MSLELWDWWERHLTEAQRRQLLVEADTILPPDLALELWRASGPLRIVEPETWSVDADPLRWRLSASAMDFVHQRRYEQTHPDED